MDQRLQYPARDRASWNEFKRRLTPKSSRRYPEHWEDYKRCARDRDYPLVIPCGSLYGWPRNWIGFENIAVMFYDDPALIHDIMEYIAEFVIELITPALRGIGDLDGAVFWEDMCFKTASMVSPNMFREFMLPRYRRIVEVLLRHDVDVIMVDSDGHVDELIPLWLEAGINGIYPLEVASGEDPVALRKRYGRDLVMWGGLDKRVLSRDKAAIAQELHTKAPVLLEHGGWIPDIDHSTPPDVPYENYRYYLEQLHSISEKGQ